MPGTLSLPANINPNFQVDDEEELTTPAPYPLWLGDYSGNVWFLAEAYTTVVRDITIPSGKTLVFPLQNHMVWGWPPEPPEAEAWMRFYLDLVLTTAHISCEIDGLPVANLERYRAQSPSVPMVLQENNLVGRPAGECVMMVDDGYYLILAPLSVGTHTIQWTASLTLVTYWNPWDPAPVPPFPQSSQEVTYHITIVPSH